METAIVGAGRVGRALGARLARAGVVVVFGVRDPARAGDVAAQAGGKALVDCTNPVRWENGPVWVPPPQGSVAQALAEALPEVHVVKGFNHFGAEIHGDPVLAGGPADALFAADDHGAKQKVMQLAALAGFRPRDAGPLRNARLLESLAVLWTHLASQGDMGRQFTFRLDERL